MGFATAVLVFQRGPFGTTWRNYSSGIPGVPQASSTTIDRGTQKIFTYDGAPIHPAIIIIIVTDWSREMGYEVHGKQPFYSPDLNPQFEHVWFPTKQGGFLPLAMTVVELVAWGESKNGRWEQEAIAAWDRIPMVRLII